MSIRLLLAGTIVVGIVTLATTHFIVRPHIQALTKARAEAEASRERERISRVAAEAELARTNEKLARTENDLRAAGTQLTQATAHSTETEQRATKLESQLTATKQTLAGAQADLAAWNSSELSVDQIKNLMAQMKRLRSTNELLRVSVEDLSFQLARAQAKLDVIFDDDANLEQALPAGLKGNVLAVDPKYDFVVLDIGAASGVEKNGRLLVNRDSKLVAELKVTRVEKDRSIADIIAGRKIRDVLAGDRVITP